MPLGGAVTVNDPEPAVKDKPTRRWSMPKAWVTAPLRTRTTEEILAASGVCNVNPLPYEMELGAVLVRKAARFDMLWHRAVSATVREWDSANDHENFDDS